MSEMLEYRLGVWVIKGPGNQITDSDENPRSKIVFKKIFKTTNISRAKALSTRMLWKDPQVVAWFNRDPIDDWDVKKQRWFLWEPNKHTNISWYGADTQYYIKYFRTGVKGDEYVYLTRRTPGNPKYRDYLMVTLSWKLKKNNDEQ